MPWVWDPTDVRAFGADSLGSRDSTAAIQAALAAVGPSGGSVFFPPGTYLISATLNPKNGTRLWAQERPTDADRSARILGPAMTVPLIERTDASDDIMIDRLALQAGSLAGSKGVHASNGQHWMIRECLFTDFGDQAIVFDAGAVNIFKDTVIQNSVMIRTGRSSIIGVVDLGSTDDLLDYVEASASMVPANGTGNIAAIVIRGGNSFLRDCIGEFSQIGIALVGTGGLNRLTATRADFNNGQGFEVDSPDNTLIGCTAYANSTTSTGVSDGFVTTAGQNAFMGCLDKNWSGQNATRYSFTDTTAGSVNMYVACRRDQVGGTGLFNFTGTPSHWP